jgi:maltose O-acetyltransferase
MASALELVAGRLRARRLMHKFNQSSPDDASLWAQVLGELLGSAGEGLHIEPPFYCDYGAFISIGERFYANFGGTILDCARVTIGDDVMLAPNVQIYAAHHPLDAATRISGSELASPIAIAIAIGSRVWIGGGAIILPGVTIGDNAVIGAGSVVTRDIPASVVAVGNPCRVVREL